MAVTAATAPARPTPAVAVALLSLAVGIVLADSAVVTLALPSILRELDAEVSEVAWVLTSFNLVLALAACRAHGGLSVGDNQQQPTHVASAAQ